MQAIYFMCSVLFHFISSFALSLVLLFRHLFWRYCHNDTDNSVTVYEGTVWHERRHPIHHSFKLSVRYALIDLDLATNPPPNHLSADEARLATGTNDPVLLLIIPPSVGYQRSPVTIYYCYDNTNTLRNCIVEVSNEPWCEKVLFSFNPDSDLVAKVLHVSLFMDMVGNWGLKTRSPGKKLSVRIWVEHPELGNYFSATLTANRVVSLKPTHHSFFFWLMPHKAAIFTYWQCLKLWWKKVPFYEHPIYKNSKYMENALVNEQKLQCCFQQVSRGGMRNNSKVEGRDDNITPTVKLGTVGSHGKRPSGLGTQRLSQPYT